LSYFDGSDLLPEKQKNKPGKIFPEEKVERGKAKKTNGSDSYLPPHPHLATEVTRERRAE